MSNESENERIDIEAYTQIFEADDGINDEVLFSLGLSAISELKRCYEKLDEYEPLIVEYDAVVGLLVKNHFVETGSYETVKHLIETHQDYKASE